ncbi:MAG: methyltransferase domain-containing protein [Sphingobacteriaceae bacterium]|nr:MAG: methyltransferase domain-containing protein [Sphingobacteriaceae bacterium]
MTETTKIQPSAYEDIRLTTEQQGFTMPSELMTCSLLCTLAASKPNSNFLELGTGTGLSTAWILEGMDAASTLISVDNDKNVQQIAQRYLGEDNRLQLVCADGKEWIENNNQLKFSYVFADTWAGKYNTLEETLNMLHSGGLYIIDDMLPQQNWPEGHAEKSTALINHLEQRTDITITKLNWASGIVIAVKK